MIKNNKPAKKWTKESQESITRKNDLIKELDNLSDLGAEIIYFDNETRHDKNITIYSFKDDEVITEIYPNIFSSIEQTELILEDMPIDEKPDVKLISILGENEENIECKICLKQIPQKKAGEHADLHKLKFSCEICGCRFNDFKKFGSHKEMHKLPSVPTLIDDPAVSEKYFKIGETRNEFSNITDFVGYKIFSHKHYMESETVDCPNCDQKFKTKKHLLIHQLREHKQVHYNCKKCNYTFLTERPYKIHLERDDCVGEFKCLFCEKIFPSKQRLSVHTMIHSRSKDSPKMFSCEFCNKEFLTQSSVNTHKRRVHEDVKGSLCTICGLALFDKTSLKTHMRSHSNDRPFNCDVCDATFRHSFDVVVHKRLHTGERPFKCSFCDQTFIANTNMTKHLKAKHFEEYEKRKKK